MRNIRKIVFGLIVLVVICNSQTVDSEESIDYDLRAGRHTKVSKKPSEKKRTSTKKPLKTRGASQQQTVPLNNRLISNLNIGPSNGLLSTLANRQSRPNGLGLVNSNVNSFMGQHIQSYAAQFPYPVVSYPSPNNGFQNFPGHQANLMGYLYGNPNVPPQNGQYPVPARPLEQTNFNIMNQNPLAPATGNFMLNGNSQTGFLNNIGIPEQPFLESQLYAGSLQIPNTELQFQQGYMNPFANTFPQMMHQQIPLQKELEMPIATFPLYPRFQRSIKLKEEM